MSSRWPPSPSAPPPPEAAPAPPTAAASGEAPAATEPDADLPPPMDDATAAPGPGRLYAGVTAYLGLPIIAAWIVACFAATAILPDFGADTGFGLVELIPGNTAALHAQAVENHLFGASLSDAQSVVVVHDPRGLSADTLVKLGQQAQVVDTAQPAPSPPSTPSFVLPLVNVPGLVPSSQGTTTTAVIYLFFRSNATSGDITTGTQRYAAAAPHPPGAAVGITGAVPAQITEGTTIENSLLLLELVTVAVIALLVGLVFRSPIAPLVPLAGSAIAYLATRHVLGLGARVWDPDPVAAGSDHGRAHPRCGHRLLGVHPHGDACPSRSRRAAGDGPSADLLARGSLWCRRSAHGCRRHGGPAWSEPRFLPRRRPGG